MSIARIYLRNFKRFSDFGISLRQTNIFVGPNNSGKSTVLDSLRLLQACLRYSRSRNPTLFEIPGRGVVGGYEIPGNRLSIPIENITTDYSDDAAIIEYTHHNKSRLVLELHPAHLPRFYFFDGVHLPRTGRAFQAAFPCVPLIVPPLAPFEEFETAVTDETVEKNRSTRLAARSFRNIWLRSTKEQFTEFAELVSASWPGTVIRRPEPPIGQTRILMFYEERRVPREIYWAGFGFQVWLQLLMHILGAPNEALFIMDEPDIYLHADLQKRLYRIVTTKFQQVFISTHSTEIINDADMGAIVSIDNRKKTARRVSTDEEYQALYNYIGAKENAELAKLARAERVIFFEGSDKKILRRFAQRTSLDMLTRDTDTLIIAAGGFSQWRRVETTAWALREVLGIDAEIFAVFDRDYRCAGELDDLRTGLERAGIRCRIWERKEVENYALCMPGLTRAVSKRLAALGGSRTSAEFEQDVWQLAGAYTGYVEEQFALHAREYHKGGGGDGEAKQKMEKWNTLEGRLELGPGKKILADLFGFYKVNFNVSLSLLTLIDELKEEEIAADMMAVLSDLDKFCTDEVSATLKAMG